MRVIYKGVESCAQYCDLMDVGISVDEGCIEDLIAV